MKMTMVEDSMVTNTDSSEACFLRFASLDHDSFFTAIMQLGWPDLSSSPLAGFIFDLYSDGGVNISKFQEVIDTARKTRALYQGYSDGDEGISLERFQKLGIQFLGESECVFPSVRAAIQLDPDASLHTSTESVRSMYVRSMLDSEAFARYNARQTGKMDEAELLAFALAIRILADVFTEFIGDDLGLTRDTYPSALKRIGVACLQRTFQGQFMDAVFTRTDRDESGIISFAEFVKAGMALIYPAAHHKYIRALQGYPGWRELCAPAPDVANIVELISSLNTGDIFLLQDDVGPMGQFINFSLNTPWSHASIVVKRSPLSGIPNLKTEELLQKYPFRRAAHHFCSPGYCRCFDSSEGDFAASKFTGLGDIGLLESTGEGIHLYDLAHRLFESSSKRWTSIAIARLHNASGRDDTAKINAFIKQVRGGIYTVAKDELKAAISFHHQNSDKTSTSGTEKVATATSKQQLQELPQGARGTDDFCASIVQRFYYHMGWVDDKRPFNSVMPSDFDIGSQEDIMAGTAPGSLTTYPVELLHGSWLSPLELVTCPDLNASLPLKLPKKKKTEQ